MSLNIIEQYNESIILATNLSFDLDEAKHRRIHLAVEFPAPDVRLREQIWQSHFSWAKQKSKSDINNKDDERKSVDDVNTTAKESEDTQDNGIIVETKSVDRIDNINKHANIILSDDVDLYQLSHEFELTGGFIRNSVLTVLKMSMLRNTNENESILLRHTDLLSACRQQISRSVVPRISIKDVVLNDDTRLLMNENILNHKSNAASIGHPNELKSSHVLGMTAVQKCLFAHFHDWIQFKDQN